MRSLELRLPPLLQVAVVAGFMWACARLLPAAALPVAGPAAWGAGAALMLAGGLLALAGVLAFRRRRTTVNPLHPEAASSMVTTGVYRITRNPMYLGMLLVLGGWALMLANAAALPGLPLFVLAMNRLQIAPEERALRSRFGAEFERYAASVRRWI